MEFVHVVKRHDLFPSRAPHGLELETPVQMIGLVERIEQMGFFVERRHAESDATLKQIIPYCVVHRKGGAHRAGEVFLMRRKHSGTEARLRGKRSVGVGGHVNPVDSGDEDTTEDTDEGVVRSGLRREVTEELSIDGEWTARPVGVLNDDTTDVGSVHVGLVYVLEVPGDVRVRETHVLEGSFVSVADLKELCRTERAGFESWSAMVVDRIDEIL